MRSSNSAAEAEHIIKKALKASICVYYHIHNTKTVANVNYRSMSIKHDSYYDSCTRCRKPKDMLKTGMFFSCVCNCHFVKGAICY